MVGNGQSDPVVTDERGDDTFRIPSPFPRLPVTDRFEGEYLSAREEDRDLLLDV